ncbi:MAG: 5-oxoprolinase [Gemmatimonadetes bacterium]|nr:5-oxoprolinase [Gemmatimonadota bacterium]
MSDDSHSTNRSRSNAWALGVDTGGTFTDVILMEPGGGQWVAKTPSTPSDPGRAVEKGIAAVLAEARADNRNSPNVAEELDVVHGTTVATNALLERRGARTALVTTRGFEELALIGRQSRPDLYALEPRRPPSLVVLSLGVSERIGSEGEIVQAIDLDELPRLIDELRRSDIASVAICLLHSYAESRHERRVGAVLRAERFDVTLSSDLVGEFREVERAWTTVANAYVAPLMSRYLRRLSRRIPRLRIMLSSGGTASAGYAAKEPIRTLLSGPAGGVVGARGVDRRELDTEFVGPSSIAFDMGGTSTDVTVCGSEPLATTEMHFAEMTLRTPVLDIHTVGAGGGSIAEIDAGGALRVGPRSAGAHPGPACYGKGGEAVTVTDANLVLGRLAADRFLGGAIRLDLDRARLACAELGSRMGGRSTEEAALGVVRVACAVMARALREITVARGIDPRGLELIAFGGAGPMHAALLAEELGIARVSVPPDPGALSARGMLAAPAMRALARTVLVKADARGMRKARRVRDALSKRVVSALRREGFESIDVDAMYDLRYEGQSYEISLPFDDADPTASFHESYRRRYGRALEDRSVEIVTVRARGVAPGAITSLGQSPQTVHNVLGLEPIDEIVSTDREGAVIAPVYERNELPPSARIHGPAIIVELTATTVVPRGWEMSLDETGQLVLISMRRSSRERE